MDKLPFQALTWEQMCSDPILRNLPYKIELNGYNQIVMSPVNFRHSRAQVKIADLLGRLLKDGEAGVETAVQTSDNVKAPDVIWASSAIVERYKEVFALPIAPEICVEVLSSSNTKAEIEQKRALYFEAGATEVWVCEQDGEMHFYSPEGEMERSVFCPKFPVRIKI